MTGLGRSQEAFIRRGFQSRAVETCRTESQRLGLLSKDFSTIKHGRDYGTGL